ncbi:MAG: carbohydrate deacetylase [Candidatus Binatia bacterium]
MKKSRLIITADDFGLWPEVNDAVVAGYESGVVSSASLRVSATGSNSAAVAARIRPGLAVGLQLVLCGGNSTLPRRHIRDLVDSTGRFVDRPVEAVWLYRGRGGLREQLKAEIRAQIEKFLSTGLYLSFVSSHYNLHLQPAVLSLLKELSEDYPVFALRRPCTRLVDHASRSGAGGFEAWTENKLMSTMVRYGGLRARRFVGPDRVDVLSPTRPTTEGDVISRLGSLAGGVTELVCRPGSLLPQYDGVAEAAVVTSRRVRDAITASGADLISYRTLFEEI